MARNTKAKKKKNPNRKEKITLTRAQLDMMLKQNARQILKGAKTLLEYNMICENHLTPEQAREQSRLMEIRAEAILDGHLTWDEIDAFLDDYYKEHPEHGEVQKQEDNN